MVDEKLDQVLRAVQALSQRIEQFESTVEAKIDQQNEEISKIRRSGIVSTVMNHVHTQMDHSQVAEACGVDGGRANALLGEVSQSLDPKHSTAEYQRQRKERQRFGGVVFGIYCSLYGALMGVSFLDIVPPFSWELIDMHIAQHFADWLGKHMHLPFVFAIVYLVIIFGIQRIMRNREGFSLRYPLALWSLMLALFSLAGSLRTVPTLVQVLYEKGVSHLICGDTRLDWVVNHPAGVWTLMFILSKVPELIDTLFIVLRKRKLITLHWYHHITVMTFCWHSWATYCLNGLVYSSMNLTVHAFMYFFYTLTALGYRPTAFAQYITVLQILQMLVGTAVTLFVNVHEHFVVPRAFTWKMNTPWLENPEYATSPECKVHPVNAIAGLLMYASYLWLFCVFFYQAYIKPRRAKRIKTE